MKRTAFVSLLILSSALSGCIRTRSDLAEEQEKQQLQNQLSNLQRGKADNESRFQEVESIFRTMNGKIENLEAQINRQAQADKDRELNGQKTDLQLTEQMKAYEEELKKLQEKLVTLEGELSQIKTAQAAPKPTPAPDKGAYTLAEELFNKKEWKSAIVQYQKYREKNPNGKRYAEATYRIGVCFEELGMQSDAKVFYEEVLEKFPKGGEAKRAKYRLSKLR